MEKEDMIRNLQEQGISLREELLSLEKQFNEKKEKFIRIQGALEALSELTIDNSGT